MNLKEVQKLYLAAMQPVVGGLYPGMACDMTDIEQRKQASIAALRATLKAQYANKPERQEAIAEVYAQRVERLVGSIGKMMGTSQSLATSPART